MTFLFIFKLKIRAWHPTNLSEMPRVR